MTEQEFKPTQEQLEEIEKGFVEDPFDQNDVLLKNMYSAIKTRDFNTDVGRILKLIEEEIGRQYDEMIKDFLKGQKINRLLELREKIFGWYESENNRYSVYRSHAVAELAAREKEKVVTIKERIADAIPENLNKSVEKRISKKKSK